MKPDSPNSSSLDDLKTKIVSVLLPFKEGATERELCQAYESLLGQRIPFEAAGFRTLRELLNVLPLARTYDRWTAIPDESTNHLARMIAAQKGPKKHARRQPPRARRQPPSRFGAQVR